jgi:dTDP-glucose 4,6-dehydratase
VENIDLIGYYQNRRSLAGREEGTSEKLITYVTDRAGHDLLYAIDATKIKNELGWEPSLQFEKYRKDCQMVYRESEWLDICQWCLSGRLRD